MAEPRTKTDTRRERAHLAHDLAHDPQPAALPPATREWLRQFVGRYKVGFEFDAQEYLDKYGE